MGQTITFRTDDATDKALAILTPDGSDRSEAIRSAVLEAAKQRRQDNLRKVALDLASNPDYQAEIQAVREDMEDLRAW